MPLIDRIFGPIGKLRDTIVRDPLVRERAKPALLGLHGAQDIESIKAQISAIMAEAASPDRWISRARPAFLYVMYAVILWAIPMGLIAAVQPSLAAAIATGMNTYLAGIPEPLWALFGTGYLGYTAARQWGKVKGVER